MSKRTSRKTPAGRREAGFTLLEILIVLAILGILAALVIPNFTLYLKKSAIEGTTRAAAGVLQQARAEAVRRGVPVIAVPDIAENDLVVWVDVDFWEDTTLVPTALLYDPDSSKPAGTKDFILTRFPLQASRRPEATVYFWAAEDANPAQIMGISFSKAIDGFTDNEDTDPAAFDNTNYPHLIVFDPDGTLRDEGWLRFGMGPVPDPSPVNSTTNNYMEVFISPAATARMNVRKYIPGLIGTLADKYQVKMKASGGGINWKWY